MTKHIFRKSGPALVALRKGYVYEGQAEIEDGFVHFTGNRKVGDERFRTHDHSWPRHEISMVRWLDDSERAPA